jgi:hypothetical protein
MPVHGRDRRRNGVPGGEEASPREQLSEVLGAKGVLSQDKQFEVLDSPCYRQLASGEPRFTDAVEAFVGIHDHEQVIPRFPSYTGNVPMPVIFTCISRSC